MFLCHGIYLELLVDRSPNIYLDIKATHSQQTFVFPMMPWVCDATTNTGQSSVPQARCSSPPDKNGNTY